MEEKELANWVDQPKNAEILNMFLHPKTPTQVQKELNIKKFNLKPFLKRGLLLALNPKAQKGRLYTLTNLSRGLLNIPDNQNGIIKDHDLIGWIMASPKQRYIALKTISKDFKKRNSEEIRKRASSLNPCFSRISTKAILRELISEDLVDSEMEKDGKRYYWITEKGRRVVKDLLSLRQKEYL
jgi:hypothetical protein